MADIIRLLGSPHDQTQALLSWYANGTLDADDLALVEAHLPDCAKCRADLEFDKALAAEFASLPLDEEHGWTAIAARLDEVPPQQVPHGLLGRRVPLGWMVAGQLAGLAAMALIFVNIATPTAPIQQYQALGATTDAQTGNLIVIFHPDTSERTLRKVLIKAEARLVDGPNVSGAYVLHVTAARRDASVAQLRGMKEVLLAEPVDASNRQ